MYSLFVQCKKKYLQLIAALIENFFHWDAHFFEAFRLIIVKKNRQNGESRKKWLCI